MRAYICLAAVVASVLPALAASLPDPIAPAASGQLQCHTPDTRRKTCASLAGYRPGENGSIINTAVMLISKNPVLTMEAVTSVEVKANQVCGKLRNLDLDAAKFAAEGQPLDARQAEQLREQMRRNFAKMLDHELCTAYVGQGGTLRSKSTMNGVHVPAADQPVLWVSPGDGYRVYP
jgi:hypothetical protein